MTTLLIDNHDSFTYNVFQLLVSLGSETIVIRNDDWAAWDALNFDQVERIVISPGPGRPDRVADFGLSRRALQERSRPVLGVCLGHQGLCWVSGGRIVRASEPVHGRAALVHHDGRELFAGLPDPFPAIRYHSLVAVDLPSTLERTAWTDDGVTMAVRHREWAAWGVQFHPESVATEHGAQLVANFLRLTGGAPRELIRPHRRCVGPVRPASHAPSGRRARWHRLPGLPDPGAALTAVFGDAATAFWIDTIGTSSPSGRVSYVGGSGGPHSESVCYHVGQDGVDVFGPDGTGRREPATIFDYLERRLTEHRMANPAPVPLNLGYVGWFGYELKALGPGHRRHESPYPDAFFVLADRMVIVDHESSTAWLGTLEDETTAGAVAAWTERAQRRLAQCRAPTPPDDDEAPPIPAHDAQLRHDGRQYAQLVGQCQEFIRAGEAYEICLTNRLRVDADVDPLAVFRTLRAMSPAPFSAYLRTPYATVVGSSPERFLAVEGGVAVSRPMKGTRRRSADPAEDARLREDLRISVKDRAENLMITDLVRHDLGSVARPGTVTVDDLYRVESYPHVHQMVSQVSAELDDGRSVVDCIRAAFPAGSMTGAPKERVLAILDDLEGSARGIYSGALGFLTLDGRVDLSVVIRTLVVTPGLITIGVGGAVTALSDPDAEVAEMLLKAEPLLRSVGAVVATAECRG